MSKDVQIAFPCPHLVVEARTEVDVLDDRTLLLRQPLAAVSLVRVLANDNLFVPAGGVQIPAKLLAGRAGPFQIPPTENLLDVQTQDARFEVLLPTGRMVTSAQVVQAINQAKPDIVGLTVESRNGRIAFDETNGTGVFSRILIGGTAATHIGLIQRGARGQEVIPGWQIVKEEDDLQVEGQPTRTVRKIQFRKPIQKRWYFKTTYTVELSRCPRCRGTGVENDWRFDEQGEVRMVGDENLLTQMGLKILLTEVGSNPYHTWYGTNFISQIGSKALANAAATIQEDARETLRRLKSLQERQATYQNVTGKERLYVIERVNVVPFEDNPTAFALDVVVRNASNQPVNITIVYTAPGVVALAGTNNLSLGTEAVGISPNFQF